MTVTWRSTTLGDLEKATGGVIQTGPFGSQLHTSDYSLCGTPVVMPTNIRDLRIDVAGIARIGQQHVDRLSRHVLHTGDIIYSRRGDVEKCALVTAQESGWLCGTGCLLVRIADVNSRYLAYALSLPETRAWISQHAIGATMPNLNTDILREVRVRQPDRATQDAIAATLGALDDKIDSNRRIVAVTDAMLTAQFTYLLATAEVTEAPLCDVTNITKGVSYKSVDLQPSRTSLVTLKSFDRTGGYKRDGLKPYAGPFKPAQVIHPGEIAVAQTDLTQGAEIVGRAVRVPADPSADVLVVSLDLAVVRPLPMILPEYLFGVLAAEPFRQQCRSHTSGTTVLHLASDAIPAYKAPIVSMEAQERFASIARPLNARADALERESIALAVLRDILLPELLLGKVQVKS